MRDTHFRKRYRKKKGGYKYTKMGELRVSDTEPAKNGVTKVSIAYMRMDSEDSEKSTSGMVLVNHEDGGSFSYATPWKGILGDRYWLPKRMARDIDNCCIKEAKIHIKNDQEPAIVVVEEDVV